MSSNVLISVATIIYNDADILEAYVQETTSLLANHYSNFELVFIDNGSIDQSEVIIKTLQSKIKNIRMISLSRHYDDEHARTAALDHCIGDYVVLMDLNCDPPSLIPRMLEESFKGYHLVIGERNNRNNESFIEKLTAKIFYRLSRLLTGFEINPNYSDYVVFSRKMVNSLVQIRDRSRYLKYMKIEIGYKHSTIKYDRIQRSNHRKRREFFTSVGFALEMIVTNSDKLLRTIALVGFFTSLLNLLYVLYVFLITLFKKDVVAGWISSSLFNSTMFSLLFLILSIISIYLSSVLKESKKGPLYYISDESTSSVIYENFDKKNIV